MLEKLPHAVGQALRGARAGLDRLVIHDQALDGRPDEIVLRSPAFEDGGRIPARYTEDGVKLSPPLVWSGVPGGSASLVLLIEDADSPSINPLVHLLLPGLPAVDGELAEGALPGPAGEGAGHSLGRNSFMSAAYLPPDPPTGHGPHRYAFQIFALDVEPQFSHAPGRGAVVGAMRGHVLGRGCLIGIYERP